MMTLMTKASGHWIGICRDLQLEESQVSAVVGMECLNLESHSQATLPSDCDEIESIEGRCE